MVLGLFVCCVVCKDKYMMIIDSFDPFVMFIDLDLSLKLIYIYIYIYIYI